MHARGLIVVVPIALMIGCSLLVDTSGLSDLGATSPGSGDGSSESSATGDAGDARAMPDAPIDGADGASSTCPVGRGPAMVRVKDVHGTFCIDTTEVTNTEFDVFLADSARPAPPAECSYRTTYGGAMRPVDAFPVTDVDWCEAWMFCAWSGKRLCGSRNGMVINDLAPANDAKVSEWYAACSHSGNTSYPYGAAADPSRCNGCDRTSTCDAGVAALVTVGSLTCEGGYPGIFDMSGNVGEWEDNCDSNGATRPLDDCPLRGGDRTLPVGSATCAVPGQGPYTKRQDGSPSSGIRCCSN